MERAVREENDEGSALEHAASNTFGINNERGQKTPESSACGSVGHFACRTSRLTDKVNFGETASRCAVYHKKSNKSLLCTYANPQTVRSDIAMLTILPEHLAQRMDTSGDTR